MTLRETQSLLAHSHLYDIDIMLRPPTLEKTGLYRYLEDGAAGLMIPHVSTPEKARMLVDAVKFPPIGDRGLDNAGIDADFLEHDADDYVAWANRETFLTVQIETPQAVENVDAIAAVEGVDVLFVGTGDLGLRLRQTKEMELNEAIERVAKAAAAHGKAWGAPALAMEEMTRFRSLGAQFLVHAGEFRALADMLKTAAADYEKLEG